MTKLNVGVVSHACTDDIEANNLNTIKQIRRTAQNGAQLVVLQELHRSVYFCQQEDTDNFDLAETIPGPSTKRYGKLAKELGIVIVLSLFEKRASGLYHNTAVVIEADGSIAGKYRKMHIPDDPGFYEKFYFAPGDLGFTPIKTSIGTLGVLVCWDQWFPEAARLMATAGADVLIYPTAIGWDPRDDQEEQQRQLDAWVTIQRSHAVANATPVISVNRVGHEDDPAGGPGTQFWGNSFITGPQGEFLYRSDKDTAIAEVIEVDLARTEDVRRIWPYLRDRRIDHYGDLLKLYRDE